MSRSIAAGRSGALLATGLLTASLVTSASPAVGAAAVDSRYGTYNVCASGNGRSYARLALLDDQHERLAILHLRRRCLTFRLGELPAGDYVIRYRAPKGRLAGVIGSSSISHNPDGTALGAANRDRRLRNPRKITIVRFTLDPNASTAVYLRTVAKHDR